MLHLTTGGASDKRRELDFYPTPKNVTIALMNFFGFITPLKIWEPACGTGSMSNVLKFYGHEVYSSDKSDYGYGVTNADFLTHNPNNKFDAIITNPPFRQSVEFIKKSLQEAPIVAMLLKTQYWHARNKYNLFNDHPPAYILPLTWRPDFLEHERKVGEKNGSPTMDVAWTVWIKGETETKYKPLLKPIQSTASTN